MIQRLAIVGLGLMGSSLGMAARRAGLFESVAGFARNPETRQLALGMGAVDTVHDTLEATVAGADMAVFCTPVLSIPDLIARAAPHLAPAAVLTDVGSTKSRITSEIGDILAGIDATFVGSHPMAGSNDTGIAAARHDLYENAVVIVTPGRSAAPAAHAVIELWQGVGAKTLVMTPEEHDDMVARTSHLPHIVASTLIDTVLREDPARFTALCGPGFRDTTRVAGGSPDLWHDIVKTNAKAIAGELRQFLSRLDEVLALIENADFDGVKDLLEAARDSRRQFEQDFRQGGTNRDRVVAIDGPSASGKSTVARLVARELGFLYVDSGALYRGVTWHALRSHVDPGDRDAIIALLARTRFDLFVTEGSIRYSVEGTEPGQDIRTMLIADNVSRTAAIPEVRARVTGWLREMSRMGSLVVEGRDIGTAVFPETPFKFYLDASPEERSRRRFAELDGSDKAIDANTVKQSIDRRDKMDSTRKAAPLRVAGDATIIDSTGMSATDVANVILERVRTGTNNAMDKSLARD